MRKMSNLLLLRRSSSSPLHKRLALSALTHLFSSPVVSNPLSSSSLINENWVSRSALQNPQFHNFTPTSSTTKPPAEWPSFGILSRGFHSGRTLQSAGYAVADLPDDNKKYSHKDDDKLEISKLGISNDIVSALAKKNITKLLPIQREVLEPAMQGRDMIGRARTGTGKTLAFGIPILDKIIRFNEKNGRGKDPLALVLAPTRELARQVDREFYESAPSLDTLCVYGGTPIMRQMSTLDRGVDIVVGTPGRVIDLIKRGSLNLSSVKFVVLDEADQMLNVGFAEDVEIILGNIRQEHQTMMFSATMPSWILKITQKFLKNPMHVDLVGDSDQKVAEGISLYSIASEMHQKAAVIGPLITEHAKGGKCIVFTQTKRDADRLAYSIQRNFKCEPLHGDISQNQRERTLSGFRDGRFNVLVATDVAARGLDVPNVDLVIHYELPNSSEIFVHRSGRTGRVGKKGTAILIYSSNQYRDVKSIERDIGSRFTELPRISVEGGSNDMFDDLGRGGDRFDSFGSMGGGRGRSSGYGNSGSGRFGRYGGSSSSRPSGSGGPGSRGGQYGSGGGYGGSNSGQSGSFGGFGSGRTGGFGNQRGSDSVGFGNFGGSDRRGSFGSLGGSSRSSGFGEFGSKRYSGFGNMNSGQNYHSASGDDRNDGNQNPRRKLL